MVYIPANQTKLYHDRKEPHLSTYEHYYDQPTAQEHPMDRTHSKLSTFAKLYPRSEYYLRNRTLDKPARNVTNKTVELFPTPPSLNFSGNMPGGETAMQTYRGNGTFELLNGLTYSWRSPKPVRLLPYKDLTFKSEYQDEYCKNKKPYPGYSVLRRSTHL